MKADLHMHTTYSDGRLDYKAVIDLAKANQVDIIAISDHDMVGDAKAMVDYGQSIGVRVLPAIELSTLEQNKSVHILGYFREDNYHDEELLFYYDDIKRKREARAKRIIRKLKEFNDIEITYESVVEQANGLIVRPHIAKAIHLAYPQYNHDYIFEHFLGDHCKAYEPSVEMPVQDGIDLLRKYNCLVVLAHPTLLKPQIKDTVLNYDFDGFEAVYYQNKPGEEEAFRALASSRNMIVTGGSDFHGIKNDTKHGTIGEVSITGADLDLFLKELQK